MSFSPGETLNLAYIVGLLGADSSIYRNRPANGHFARSIVDAALEYTIGTVDEQASAYAPEAAEQLLDQLGPQRNALAHMAQICTEDARASSEVREFSEAIKAAQSQADTMLS